MSDFNQINQISSHLAFMYYSAAAAQTLWSVITPSGSGRPAEARQSWSAGEHEAGPWCCFDWKPHQGVRRSEKSPLPNTTRSGRQTHLERRGTRRRSDQMLNKWEDATKLPV